MSDHAPVTDTFATSRELRKQIGYAIENDLGLRQRCLSSGLRVTGRNDLDPCSVPNYARSVQPDRALDRLPSEIMSSVRLEYRAFL